MKKYEFKTGKVGFPQVIEADDYVMDNKTQTLTFINESKDQIASYHTGPGAYVKRVDK